jgi:hypothetical protein
MIAQRFANLTDADRPLLGPRRYTGRVLCRLAGDQVRLSAYPSFANSFRPFFYGSLRPDGTGAILEGQFRVHTGIRLFVTIWLLGVIGIGTVVAGASVLALLRGTLSPGAAVFDILLLPLILGAFVLIRKAVRASERREELEVVRFLESEMGFRRAK